jgi:hypothetical protein
MTLCELVRQSLNPFLGGVLIKLIYSHLTEEDRFMSLITNQKLSLTLKLPCRPRALVIDCWRRDDKLLGIALWSCESQENIICKRCSEIRSLQAFILSFVKCDCSLKSLDMELANVCETQERTRGLQ